MDFLKLIYITYFLHFCAHSKGTVFDEESNFLVVSRTKAFVDKTMLIKTVFQSGRRMLITAPRKFGKSTNLDMLKRFLSLQSKNNVEILHIFKNLKIYENNSKFFCDNFAKHPVLYVDFKSETTNSYEEAIDGYKRAIHNAYLEHEYLIDSQKLLDYDKTACKKWCGRDSFKQLGEEYIMSGLAGLAGMLKKHFSKEVMLLIDEYDSIINNALFEIESNSQFRDIVSFTSDILTTLLKSNNNVQIAVVTGVSYISPPGLSAVNNLQRFRFLENHEFVQFYGFTDKEVDYLFGKKEFNLDLKEIEKARSLYNGYKCRVGRKIYNTFSVLSFIAEGEARNHSLVTGHSTNLINCFQFPEIENCIGRLLMGESIKITFYYDIDMYHVSELRKTFFKEIGHVQPNEDLLFCHFLELGLLTQDTEKELNNGNNDVVYVKLPNLEVNNNIFRLYKDYYVNKYHLRREDLKNVTNYSALRNTGALIREKRTKETERYVEQNTGTFRGTSKI